MSQKDMYLSAFGGESSNRFISRVFRCLYGKNSTYFECVWKSMVLYTYIKENRCTKVNVQESSIGPFYQNLLLGPVKSFIHVIHPVSHHWSQSLSILLHEHKRTQRDIELRVDVLSGVVSLTVNKVCSTIQTVHSNMFTTRLFEHRLDTATPAQSMLRRPQTS